jgi:hypothetical protein
MEKGKSDWVNTGMIDQNERVEKKTNVVPAKAHDAIHSLKTLAVCQITQSVTANPPAHRNLPDCDQTYFPQADRTA